MSWIKKEWGVKKGDVRWGRTYIRSKFQKKKKTTRDSKFFFFWCWERVGKIKVLNGLIKICFALSSNPNSSLSLLGLPNLLLLVYAFLSNSNISSFTSHSFLHIRDSLEKPKSFLPSHRFQPVFRPRVSKSRVSNAIELRKGPLPWTQAATVPSLTNLSSALLPRSIPTLSNSGLLPLRYLVPLPTRCSDSPDPELVYPIAHLASVLRDPNSGVGSRVERDMYSESLSEACYPSSTPDSQMIPSSSLLAWVRDPSSTLSWPKDPSWSPGGPRNPKFEVAPDVERDSGFENLSEACDPNSSLVELSRPSSNLEQRKNPTQSLAERWNPSPTLCRNPAYNLGQRKSPRPLVLMMHPTSILSGQSHPTSTLDRRKNPTQSLAEWWNPSPTLSCQNPAWGLGQQMIPSPRPLAEALYPSSTRQSCPTQSLRG